jgi:hypothetical protein
LIGVLAKELIMAAWKLTSDEWEAVDRFRFKTRDASEFRNGLIILKSAAGESKAGEVKWVRTV